MGSNKIDKGFELIYWRFSYRRKFIRTLWLMPINIILSMLIFLKADLLFYNRIISILIIVIVLFQLYNYMKWKKYESKVD